MLRQKKGQEHSEYGLNETIWINFASIFKRIGFNFLLMIIITTGLFCIISKCLVKCYNSIVSNGDYSHLGSLELEEKK